jgi:hypothetical protein
VQSANKGMIEQIADGNHPNSDNIKSMKQVYSDDSSNTDKLLVRDNDWGPNEVNIKTDSGYVQTNVNTRDIKRYLTSHPEAAQYLSNISQVPNSSSYEKATTPEELMNMVLANMPTQTPQPKQQQNIETINDNKSDRGSKKPKS